MHNIYAVYIVIIAIFTTLCSDKRDLLPVDSLASAKMFYAREKDYPFGSGYYFHDELPANTVYLTFDDGPSDWTSGILDTLAEDNIKATFFICGRFNMKGRSGTSFKIFREVLLRMKNEGHVIANHTATHRVLTWMSDESIRYEILANQKMLDDALGDNSVTMTIFRPPMGCPWLSRVPAAEKIRVANITGSFAVTLLWTYRADSTDSWDWAEGEWYRKGPGINTGSETFKMKKTRIYRAIAGRAQGQGMVVLFHDTHNTTAEVLPEIIKALKEKNYLFGTAEDLLYWKYGMYSRDLISSMK
ncbi:MAG: polysaccharide deacetylase family protein [Spirochaetes bacterium]|nr:polysaccharide deacetylase family protein [Spirochaetota bacterium]